MITQRRSHRVGWAVLALFLVASLLLPSGAALAAPEVINWVGNLSPASGSETTVASGDPFTVTVEAYKAGVTDVIAGDSYEIACTLYWSQVATFGDLWQATPFETPMSWEADAGNNDRFTATVTPLSGKYEFTAYCDDLTDGVRTWGDVPSGNVKLTVTAPTFGSCLGAAVDGNVYWSALLHDSFSTEYRTPLGAVNNAQGAVTLRVRTCRNDLTEVKARVWDDRTDTETLYDMAVGPELLDPTHGEVTFWTVNLPIPVDPTILYYTFRLIDGSKTVYYRDDDTKFYGGGLGTPTDDQGAAEMNSYQLTVYDQNFTTPDWLQKGVIYQIFPDRFRDGNSANDPAAGRFYYNVPSGSIVRSYTATWNTLICDPRSTYTPACADKYGENFYGGDLAGITQKLNEGYFNNLGVTTLYLTPIFRSPSNHKYDTANYRNIDPDFGGSTAFQNLVTAAAANRIKIVLDGVFNHTSSDSAYFDRYSRFNYADTLVRNDYQPFADDGSGGCESPASARRPWYFLPDVGLPSANTFDRCDPDDGDDVGGPWNVTYETWYGYGSLPKLNPANQGVRDLVYAKGLAVPYPSIGPYWINQGADGWRLDVGGDIDPGLTNDPANDYWEGFRAKVKSTDVQTRTVPAIIGEEWGDASPWLLGNEWDSAMNYRLRSAALGWLFTGCTGDGCTDGTQFEDNDSNVSSASGVISSLTPSQFNARLRSIQEDYPPQAFKAMMNIGGSHDTNRLRFLLKKINSDDDAAALQRLQEYWLFAMTYAGAPTLYYGDELAVQADGVWANGKWEDDPYNRAPFPWEDTPGAYTAYTATLPFLRALTSARSGFTALQYGDVQHGLVISDTEKVYAFARTVEAEQRTALIALNRDTVTHTVVFKNLEQAPYLLYPGEPMMDVLTRTIYNAACDDAGLNCTLTVDAPPQLGVVLVNPDKAETPDPPLLFLGIETNQTDLNLNWAAIIRDTTYGYEFPNRYEVWRSETPYDVTGDYGTMTKLAEVGSPDFGVAGNRREYIDVGAVGDPLINHYYKVVAVNGAGGRSVESREMAEFDFSLTPGTSE